MQFGAQEERPPKYELLMLEPSPDHVAALCVETPHDKLLGSHSSNAVNGSQGSRSLSIKLFHCTPMVSEVQLLDVKQL